MDENYYPLLSASFDDIPVIYWADAADSIMNVEKRGYFDLEGKNSCRDRSMWWKERRRLMATTALPTHKSARILTDQEFKTEEKKKRRKRREKREKEKNQAFDSLARFFDDEEEEEDEEKYECPRTILPTKFISTTTELDISQVQNTFTFNKDLKKQKARRGLIGTYQYVQSMSRMFVRDTNCKLVPLPLVNPTGYY